MTTAKDKTKLAKRADGRAVVAAACLQVIRWVKDRHGNSLATLMDRYDGTAEDARSKAKDVSRLMDRLYPEASHIQSQIGATDERGDPKFEISPNFKLVYDLSEHKQAS